MLVDVGGLGAGPIGQVVTVLAQQAPPGQGPEFGKASPVGLIVVLLLAVATALLIRSMSKRIKRLPESFDPPAEQPDGVDEQPGDDAVPRSGRDTEDAGGGRA
jgi:hypothetical protein